MTKGKKRMLITGLNIDSIAQKEIYAALENNLHRKTQELANREFETVDDILKRAKPAIKLARTIDRENKTNHEAQVYLALKANPSNPAETLKKATSAETILKSCANLVAVIGGFGAIFCVPLFPSVVLPAMFFGAVIPLFAAVILTVTGIFTAIYFIIRAASALHRSRINNLIKRVEHTSNTPATGKKTKSDDLLLTTATLCKDKEAEGKYTANWPFTLIAKNRCGKQGVSQFCPSASTQTTR